MSLTQREIQHFHLRTGFGEAPATIRSQVGSSRQDLVHSAFSKANRVNDLSTVPNPVANGREAGNLKVLRMILKSKRETEKLNLDWLQRMADTEAPLQEKMTFFWHDHFATATPFAYLMQVQNNTLRRHALGDFKRMMHAVAKDPAMLLFLNSQQNRKGHPNENFAREVMELFTLGIGHYTEKDVQEAARAFTGWQVNRLGQFEFNPGSHDDGQKTFLGRTGHFKGEDIIDMLLESPITARHICAKLYRFMVNHEEDPAFVDEMVQVFISSRSDIGAVLRHVLLSDHFYAERNIGSRIASPTELLVRYLRMFNMTFKGGRQLLRGQKLLGQVLLFPPNVSGWGSQRDWVDGASLLLRMRLPSLILAGNGPLPMAKADPESEDEMMTQSERPQRNSWSQPDVDWSGISRVVSGAPRHLWAQTIASYLLQRPVDEVDIEKIRQMADDSSADSLVRSLTISTMSLPEFQLI